MSREQALALAKETDSDLVLIAPSENPPVCRITNYGKLRYEQNKRERKERRGQKSGVLKELKVRPKTDKHDLMVRVNHAREFLSKGNKVKLTMVFRGRENSHPEIGRKILDGFISDLQDIGHPEAPPKREGRNIILLFAPK